MKIFRYINRSLLIITAFLLALPLPILAQSSDAINDESAFISNTIAEPAVNIQNIIQEKVTKEIVDARYRIFSAEKPDEYTYDPTVYLVEYNVSTDYWNRVETLDYQGLCNAIDHNYPTIYIPLFADLADTSGKLHNRVIGHIKLSYNWSKKDYSLGMSLYNLSSDEFKDRENIWFYEEISEYLAQSKKSAQQVFLIRYPTSLSDGHEKIAVIKTDDATVILDVSNSLKIDSTEMRNGRAKAYTLDQYRTSRMEIEKTLYQASDGWESNPAGGNTASNFVDILHNKQGLILCSMITVAVIITIAVLVRINRKKRAA